MTYTEAVDVLQKSGKSFEFPVEWGNDLQSEHERYLAEEYVSGRSSLTDYPKEHQSLLHAAERRRQDRRGHGRARPQDRRDHRRQPARRTPRQAAQNRIREMGLPEENYGGTSTPAASAPSPTPASASASNASSSSSPAWATSATSFRSPARPATRSFSPAAVTVRVTSPRAPDALTPNLPALTHLAIKAIIGMMSRLLFFLSLLLAVAVGCLIRLPRLDSPGHDDLTYFGHWTYRMVRDGPGAVYRRDHSTESLGDRTVTLRRCNYPVLYVGYLYAIGRWIFPALTGEAFSIELATTVNEPPDAPDKRSFAGSSDCRRHLPIWRLLLFSAAASRAAGAAGTALSSPGSTPSIRPSGSTASPGAKSTPVKCCP